jgi:hypothetical protein
MMMLDAFAAQKDSANQIFLWQLFANQNRGAHQTFLATLTAQLPARLCLFNLDPRSPKGLVGLVIMQLTTTCQTTLKAG